jgi:hypothetical protein
MEAFVCHLGGGRRIDCGEFEVSVVADAPDTGGICSVVETYGVAETGPPLHVHHDAAEAFYIVEGEYVMVLGDEEVTCKLAPSSSSRPGCRTPSEAARTQGGS